MAAVLMAGYTASAQGFYGELNVGYGFGYPSSVLGTTSHTTIVNGLPTGSTTENNYGSVGQGLNLTLAPGYMFNEHIGVELGLNYFLGSNVLVSQATSDFTSNALGMQNVEWNNGNGHAQSNQFRVIPALVLSTGTSNKLSGYVKAGLIVPVGGKTVVTTERNIYTLNPLNGTSTKDVEESETVTKGNITVGFRGAIGLNFAISDKISVFGEVFSTALQIKAKHSELTKRTLNGVSLIDNEEVIDLQTDFVNEVTTGNGTVVDNNAPSQALATKTNFNQLGLAIGVKFNF